MNKIDLEIAFNHLLLLAVSLAIHNDAKNLKIPETLPNGYSSESTQQELSNEYQRDKV